MKLKTTFYVFLFVFSANLLNAQVGIGTNAPKGMLDVTSNNMGIVYPVAALSSTIDETTITSPSSATLAVGTLVYNTNTTDNGSNDVTPGIYSWNGSKWVPQFSKRQSQLFQQTGVLRTLSTVITPLDGYQFVPGFTSETFSANYTGLYRIKVNVNYGGGAMDSPTSGDINTAFQEGDFRFTFNGTDYNFVSRSISTYNDNYSSAIEYTNNWVESYKIFYVALVAEQDYTFSLAFNQTESEGFEANGDQNLGLDGRGYIGEDVPCTVEFTYISE
ncbi:hypothetical protein [Marixanthomonas ophiurae]|uniref:Uncharacterized protein n=1 Tax=Marixanthomonas ophiurae TaxID=387659 RepID=A0A3E1Q9E8_9FLAO|nr:hypothetical protein [Marixanthomonas ophiurae]RFN58753.1 hypothetical protein DZ858_01335 [Marixanthomonas ophiurae]